MQSEFVCDLLRKSSCLLHDIKLTAKKYNVCMILNRKVSCHAFICILISSSNESSTAYPNKTKKEKIFSEEIVPDVVI